MTTVGITVQCSWCILTGWAWFIPLHDGTVSVGIMQDHWTRGTPPTRSVHCASARVTAPSQTTTLTSSRPPPVCSSTSQTASLSLPARTAAHTSNQANIPWCLQVVTVVTAQGLRCVWVGVWCVRVGVWCVESRPSVYPWRTLNADSSHLYRWSFWLSLLSQFIVPLIRATLDPVLD